jgi:hypothetical protein
MLTKIRGLKWYSTDPHLSLEISVADPNPDLYPSDPYILGLLDPDPDPLVRGLDPDLDFSIIKQKQ